MIIYYINMIINLAIKKQPWYPFEEFQLRTIQFSCHRHTRVNTCSHLDRTLAQSRRVKPLPACFPFGLHAPDSSQISHCMTLITG